MKIGIDSGALCGPRLGNYIFTENLLKALIKFDKKNKYFLYSFCNKPVRLKLNKNFIYKKLLPKKGWLKFRVSLAEKINKKDIFLALNQAIPYTKASIISFSHGTSFIKYKKFYLQNYIRLKRQLDNMINKSKFIIVSSKKVKSELIKYGAKTHQTKIINFGIPNDMLTTSKRSPKKYFLFVGVNQKIKNIKFIINRFKEFLKFKKDYKLILVLNNFIKSNNKNIKILSNISRQRLQKLYLSANAYLSASYYESFNFPILEALSQKCPVISLKSSVIPEMQKYVNIANNSKEFLKLMQRSVNNDLKTVNINVIKRKFSWNNYVKKLYLLFNRNDKILK